MRNTTGIVSLCLVGMATGCVSSGYRIGFASERIKELSVSHVAVFVNIADGVNGKYEVRSDTVLASVERFVQRRGFKVVDRAKDTGRKARDELARCVYSGRFDSGSCVEEGENVGADAVLLVTVTSARSVVSFKTKLFDLVEQRLGGGESVGAKFDVRVKMSARMVDLQTKELAWSGNGEGTDIVLQDGYLGESPGNCVSKLMRRFPRHLALAETENPASVESEASPN